MQFSIIIPVYNVERYLSECLKSIEKQTCQDFELILVDDGSTDKSGIICDEYAKTHSNTCVIHKENKGALFARRTGIDIAKGNYLVFCDSDDTISENVLEELEKKIKDYNPDMFMYGYNIVDDQGNELEDHYHTFEDGKIFDENNKEILLKELATTAWLNNMVTKATKRQLVIKDRMDYSRYKSIVMGEDLFQVISLVNNCKTFMYIAKPLYHYRRNPSGMSKRIRKEYLDNYLIISERVLLMLEESNVSQSTFVNYYNRYILDVYKYLLRFLKIDVTKSEYENSYEKVIGHSVYLNALRMKKQWTRTNKVLFHIVKPQNMMAGILASKTVFSKRLELR